jgi:ring-1,2-phenylacetyl-CoA epoxidase subunit PaaE
MSQYFFLKVKEVIRETAEAVTLVFEKPINNVSYKSGQFLTFLIEIGGEKLRRSYSLSSSPYTSEDWAVSVKKVQGGQMSTYLLEKIKKGDQIEVMAPAGIFTYEPSVSNTSDIVLIGAGSGITPLYSVISSALAIEKSSRVYLIYANRNEESIMLKAGLENFVANYPDRFTMINVFSKPLNPSIEHSGRLDKNRISKLLGNFKSLNFDKALFFVCGPQGMMDAAFQVLDMHRVPHTNIRKESFTSVIHVEDKNIHAVAGAEGVVVVEIKYNKQLYKVNVAPGQSILEAALDQDIDLPYSCQSGMCTACMGKCKNGQVKMDDPDGLSENEIKQGFVLTCVGKPMTADVLIEID